LRAILPGGRTAIAIAAFGLPARGTQAIEFAAKTFDFLAKLAKLPGDIAHALLSHSGSLLAATLRSLRRLSASLRTVTAFTTLRHRPAAIATFASTGGRSAICLRSATRAILPIVSSAATAIIRPPIGDGNQIIVSAADLRGQPGDSK
jgi:hypothetical protein